MTTTQSPETTLEPKNDYLVKRTNLAELQRGCDRAMPFIYINSQHFATWPGIAVTTAVLAVLIRTCAQTSFGPHSDPNQSG